MKVILTILLTLLSISIFPSDSNYKIDHRLPLEGAEGWDCLSIDSHSDRLYITRGNHIDILDLKSEKIIGKISEHIDGAHGVAFVDNLKKGYATSGKTSMVVVFDLESFKIIKEIKVGKKPDIIFYDEFSKYLLSFNADDNSVSVIDPKLDSVIKTIKLESNPEFAVSDDKGIIYVNLEDKSLISAIDTKELVVKKTWPITGCNEPTGLAIDSNKKNLFSTCANEVMAITDIASNKVIQTLKIGKKPDGAAFDNDQVFSSNGSGSLTIVKKNVKGEYEVLQELQTQKGARTMTIDSKTHNAYILTAKYEPADVAHPDARPKIIPGSVEILIVKK